MAAYRTIDIIVQSGILQILGPDADAGEKLIVEIFIAAFVVYRPLPENIVPGSQGENKQRGGYGQKRQNQSPDQIPPYICNNKAVFHKLNLPILTSLWETLFPAASRLFARQQTAP